MAEFIRCVSKATHGGRCWRGTHTSGKHLVLDPGKKPTFSQIERIIAARPDMNREFVFQTVLAESAKVTRSHPARSSSPRIFDRVFKEMDAMFEGIFSKRS